MSEYIVNMGDERESPFSVLAKLSRVGSYGDVREEIVRCRDCKHNNKGFCGVFCCGIQVNGDGVTYLYPDFFCANCERRMSGYD